MIKTSLALLTSLTMSLGLYPTTCQITNLDRQTDIVTMQTSTGYQYQFYGCEDYDNGDLYPIDSNDDFWLNGTETEGNLYALDDDGFYYYYIDGDKIDADDVEPTSLWDYFFDDYGHDNIYNIDYVLDSNKELQAVRVMVACGGPNIYINTWDKRVELFWWSESGSYWLPSDLCEEITDVFRETF